MFDDLLEAWLTNTLARLFSLRWSSAERGYVELHPEPADKLASIA